MAGTTLTERIKAEFDARAKRQREAEEAKAKGSQEREQRLARFAKACEDLQGVWKPKIEEFAGQFGEKLQITPTVTPSVREAKMVFLTELANVTLTLSVAPNTDVTKLVLDYDLLIIPIFFEYERHARLEMPLDKIDKAALGKWIEDRLVSCVNAYLSIQDNQFYLKRALVEDPITKAKFLPDSAAAKLDHKGQTYYFSSEASLREFKAKHQIR